MNNNYGVRLINGLSQNEWTARNKKTGEIFNISGKSYSSTETVFTLMSGNNLNSKKVLKIEEFEKEYEFVNTKDIIKDFINNNIDSIKEYLCSYSDGLRLSKALYRRFTNNYFEEGATYYLEADSVYSGNNNIRSEIGIENPLIITRIECSNSELMEYKIYLSKFRGDEVDLDKYDAYGPDYVINFSLVFFNERDAFHNLKKYGEIF